MRVHHAVAIGQPERRRPFIGAGVKGSLDADRGSAQPCRGFDVWACTNLGSKTDAAQAAREPSSRSRLVSDHGSKGISAVGAIRSRLGLWRRRVRRCWADLILFFGARLTLSYCLAICQYDDYQPRLNQQKAWGRYEPGSGPVRGGAALPIAPSMLALLRRSGRFFWWSRSTFPVTSPLDYLPACWMDRARMTLPCEITRVAWPHQTPFWWAIRIQAHSQFFDQPRR